MSAAEKMRDACAKIADDLTDQAESDHAVWHSSKIAAAIRALPIPAPQPDPRRSADEIRAEIARLRTSPDRFGFTAIRIATLEWVLSATQEPAK